MWKNWWNCSTKIKNCIWTFGMISAGGSSRFLLLRKQQHMARQMAMISNDIANEPDAIIIIGNFPVNWMKRREKKMKRIRLVSIKLSWLFLLNLLFFPLHFIRTTTRDILIIKSSIWKWNFIVVVLVVIASINLKAAVLRLGFSKKNTHFVHWIRCPMYPNRIYWWPYNCTFQSIYSDSLQCVTLI